MRNGSFRIAAQVLTVAFAISALSCLSSAQTKKTPRPAPALKVGDAAPDFKLQYFDGHGLKNVSLADYRGKKNVVLAFYVFAFTGG
jgi:cytochrome oxidase Cu insertion factor (SCO1/SenC/PrrC family)